MKNYKKILIILFLLIIYVYTCNITMIPSNYILFQGESFKLNTLLGINIKQVSSNNPNLENFETYIAKPTSTTVAEQVPSAIGTVRLSLNLFNQINLREISVNVIPKTTVIPVGNIVGLKLYTKGVLVVGMCEIEGEDSNKYKPYEQSGIIEGDIIVSINENKINSTDDLIKYVNESNGEQVNIKYLRNEGTFSTDIKPTKTVTKDYKIGLWVRDTAAGVGTCTFYEPNTNMFAALGHGIIDIDTEKLINIVTGDVVTTNVVSVSKGEKGRPGEIRGTVENQDTIGKIYKNTSFGIFGDLTNFNALNINKNDEIEVALREEIVAGPAKVICTIDNKKDEYDIQIQKIYLNNNHNNKSMLIEVTDKNLLAKTGGIIQGMSGSPIIQNGKFIGAVTYVLVSDPTQGYAVFGDLMIKQMREVK